MAYAIWHSPSKCEWEHFPVIVMLKNSFCNTRQRASYGEEDEMRLHLLTLSLDPVPLGAYVLLST